MMIIIGVVVFVILIVIVMLVLNGLHVFSKDKSDSSTAAPTTVKSIV